MIYSGKTSYFYDCCRFCKESTASFNSTSFQRLRTICFFKSEIRLVVYCSIQDIAKAGIYFSGILRKISNRKFSNLEQILCKKSLKRFGFWISILFMCISSFELCLIKYNLSEIRLQARLKSVYKRVLLWRMNIIDGRVSVKVALLFTDISINRMVFYKQKGQNHGNWNVWIRKGVYEGTKSF